MSESNTFKDLLLKVHDLLELDENSDHLFDEEEDDEDDDVEYNQTGHEHRTLPPGQEMPLAPHWDEGNLIVPPSWDGTLSDVKFRAAHQEEGTLLMADIPGEHPCILTAMCTDGQGLIDAAQSLDNAIAVATDPDSVPEEFLRTNTLSLFQACRMFKFSIATLQYMIQNTPRHAEKTQEYDAQLKNNLMVQKYLGSICERVENALKRHVSPELLSASTQATETARLH